MCAKTHRNADRALETNLCPTVEDATQTQLGSLKKQNPKNNKIH